MLLSVHDTEMFRDFLSDLFDGGFCSHMRAVGSKHGLAPLPPRRAAQKSKARKIERQSSPSSATSDDSVAVMGLSGLQACMHCDWWSGASPSADLGKKIWT